ncbi:MAG: DUF4349 domain-containing protein, partial [Clostridiales bacterium]|nr:DUF4349 domain-containing protein [Clostridiales bacterium]
PFLPGDICYLFAKDASVYSPPEEGDKQNPPSLGEAPAGNEARAVIRNAEVSLEVGSATEAHAALAATAAKYGGYIAYSNISETAKNKKQENLVSLKVGAEHLDAALEEIAALGDLKSQNVKSAQIDDRFYDLQGRLNQYRAEESALLDILRQADALAEIKQAETELSRVRANIETCEGQLLYLTQTEGLSTINVALRVPSSDALINAPGWENIGGRLARAFTAPVGWLINGFAVLLALLFGALPFIAAAFLVFLFYKVFRPRFRRG